MAVIIQFWNKGKMKYYLLAVHMMVFWILINCIGQLLDMDDNVYLRNADVNQYKLYDNYIGELERSFFQSQDSVAKLKHFYEWLSSNPLFQYENINTQGIYIEGAWGEPDCIQVSESFSRLNNVKVEKGEYFSADDYEMESFDKVVPVLVGHKLANMDVGDTFNFHYMGVQFKGRIKGILTPGSSYMIRNEIKTLENYVIIPSFDFAKSPETHDEWAFQLKLYLDKAAGIIVTDVPVRILKTKMDEVCVSLKLEPYGIEGLNVQRPNIWGSMGNELKRTNFIFIVYIVTISIIGFAVECQTRVLQLRRKYAIANLNGYSRKNIILGVGTGIFLELLIPALLVTGFDYIMYKSIYIYPYLLAYMICALVISFLTCIATMGRASYWQDVRGKKHGNHLS